MARCVIHGCVDLKTGEIRFNSLSDCLLQDACLHVVGKHAGQVALTLTGGPIATPDDCNDTFYSECINYWTGRFRILVPDALVYIAGDGIYRGAIHKLDTGIPTYNVSGELDPDVTGDYRIAGTYNDKPYYSLEGNGWFIWWVISDDPYYNSWIISEELGVTDDPLWYFTSIYGEIVGDYTPSGATGIATVAANDPLIWYLNFRRIANCVASDTISDSVYVGGNLVNEACVWKLDSNGNIIWEWGGIAHVHGIAVDTNGNVCIATSAETGYIVWKLNGITGELIWRKSGVGPALGIAVNADGDVYVAKERAGGAEDSVWKLDKDDGHIIWDHDTNSAAFGIAVDVDGNAYVVGNRDVANSKSVWKLGSGTGSEIWSYDTGANTKAITVDADNKAHVVGVRTGSVSVWKLTSGGGLDWDYDASGENTYSIVVDGDGNVYVGGGGPRDLGGSGGPPNVWKLSSSGNFLFSYNLGGCGYGIAVEAEGVVYVVGYLDLPYSQNVHKISACCGILWNFKTGGASTKDVVVDTYGNVYVAAETVGVYKLDKDGNEIWHNDESATEMALGVAVDDDGDVYAAAQHGACKLNGDTGELIWYEALTNGITRKIAVDATGNAYVVGDKPAGENESVWKLDTDDGHIIWSFFTGDHTFGVAVGLTGDICVAGKRTDAEGDMASVWKLNTDGDELWRYDTGDHVGPVDMDDDGNVYVTGSGNGVWELDSEDGHQLWYDDMSYDEFTYIGHDIFVDSFGDIYVVADGIMHIGGLWHWDSLHNLIWMYYIGARPLAVFKGCMGRNVLQ